jgi:hypothetical protein
MTWARKYLGASVGLIASVGAICGDLAISSGVRDAVACDVELGENASLGGSRAFPDDDPWNRDISRERVDTRSQEIIARIGPEYPVRADFGSGLYRGARIGIPYVVVPKDQPLVPVRFTGWPDESDAGPYPIPPGAPVEGAGGTAGPYDRHVIVVQRDPARPGCLGRLFELFDARRQGQGGWQAANGAVFDLASNTLRPAGWTSADAAGLPIFPGLVRYDEVAAGEIRHALRVTVPETRKAYVHPARHWASARTDPDLPPMGTRLRLKAGFDLSPLPQEAQVIGRALKRYGMIVADNGGGWFISGAPDERWNNDELRWLGEIHGNDLEVLELRAVLRP